MQIVKDEMWDLSLVELDLICLKSKFSVWVCVSVCGSVCGSVSVSLTLGWVLCFLYDVKYPLTFASKVYRGS